MAYLVKNRKDLTPAFPHKNSFWAELMKNRTKFKFQGIYNRGSCAFGINTLDGADILSLPAYSTRAWFWGMWTLHYRFYHYNWGGCQNIRNPTHFLLQNQGSAQQLTTGPQYRAANTLHTYMGMAPISGPPTGAYDAALQSPGVLFFPMPGSCPWAVNVTSVPYFYCERVRLQPLSTASHCAFSSLIKDLLDNYFQQCWSLRLQKNIISFWKQRKVAGTGDSSRRERLEREEMALGHSRKGLPDSGK